ncbi:MAG: hypothetical protein IPK82_23710 [Polyangiaceae bacterium]|nr:hypothetical protein [Polyangiaceae bacterium]
MLRRRPHCALRRPVGLESFQIVKPTFSQPVTNQAIAALAALARRDATNGRALGRELALKLLRSPHIVMALRVLAGGQHVDGQITDLCTLAIESAQSVPTIAASAADGAASKGGAR